MSVSREMPNVFGSREGELCAVLSGKETGIGTRGHKLRGGHRGQRSAAFLGLGDSDGAHTAWQPGGSRIDPRLCSHSA